MRKKKEITSTDIVPYKDTVRVDYKMWQHYLKWGIFIVFMFSLFYFSYCHNPKSNDDNYISKQHYSFAQSAINIADDYLNYDITAIDAYDDLQRLCDNIEFLPDNESHLENSIEFSVQFELNYAFINAFGESTSKHYSEVLDIRNELAEIIGARSRKY